MKPMHSAIKWLSRCSCCTTNFTTRHRHLKAGKGATRQKQKRDLRSDLANKG